jgi:hypothetical protein
MALPAPAVTGQPALAIDPGSIRLAWVATRDAPRVFGPGVIGDPGESTDGGTVRNPLLSLYQSSGDFAQLPLTAGGHGRDISPLLQNHQMQIQSGVSLVRHKNHYMLAWCSQSVLDDVTQSDPVTASGTGNPGASAITRDNRIRIGHYIEPPNIATVIAELIPVAVFAQPDH